MKYLFRFSCVLIFCSSVAQAGHIVDYKSNFYLRVSWSNDRTGLQFFRCIKHTDDCQQVVEGAYRLADFERLLDINRSSDFQEGMHFVLQMAQATLVVAGAGGGLYLPKHGSKGFGFACVALACGAAASLAAHICVRHRRETNHQILYRRWSAVCYTVTRMTDPTVYVEINDVSVFETELKEFLRSLKPVAREKCEALSS